MKPAVRKALLAVALPVAAAIPPSLIALPSVLKLSELRATPATPAADPAEARAETELKALLDGDWGVAAAAAGRLANSVPIHEGRGDRLLLLEHAAETHGVRISAAADAAGASTAGGGYTLPGHEVTVHGRCDALLAFVRAVESGERAAIADRLRIERDDSSGLDLRLVAVFRFPMRAGASDPAAFAAGASE